MNDETGQIIIKIKQNHHHITQLFVTTKWHKIYTKLQL